MGVILLKTSYPDTSLEHAEFKLVQNENEKERLLSAAKNKLYHDDNNTSQFIKLQFIYPDEVETHYFKA